MYLAYFDDSRQKAQDGSRQLQIMGGILVHDSHFEGLEQHLGYTIQELVPVELRANFEFHACDLLQRNKPFEGIKRDRALQILMDCVGALEYTHAEIVYAAMDLTKLNGSIHSGIDPLDPAFQLCAVAAEEWFRSKHPEETGLIICDDIRDRGKVVQSCFHRFRKTVYASPVERGELAHFVDEVYFGDSAFSRGIQLADVCCLLIGRHLLGRDDTESLYAKIAPRIFKGIVWPDDGQTVESAKMIVQRSGSGAFLC